MSKLLDMFTQARRAQSSGGIGFVGKTKAETKPRVAALVIEFTGTDAGSAEAAIKAGADGLLFTWNGKDTNQLDTLKSGIEAAKVGNENAAFGLQISGNWDKLERESIEQLKDKGVNYVVLPLNAPARLLALQTKDIDIVVTVPMREGDMYPVFIRNLTAFNGLTAVRLDFDFSGDISTMSIEDIMHYRAVREAVRIPALLNVQKDLSEADAYTLTTLGVQAVVLKVSDTGAASVKQIKALREILEKVHHDEKDKSNSMKL